MKDIHWLANRLKSMNTREVAWRIQQKILQKQEYCTVYSLHLPVTEIPLNRKLQNLHADAKRIPFNAYNEQFMVFQDLDLFRVFDYQLFHKEWNLSLIHI